MYTSHKWAENKSIALTYMCTCHLYLRRGAAKLEDENTVMNSFLNMQIPQFNKHNVVCKCFHKMLTKDWDWSPTHPCH